MTTLSQKFIKKWFWLYIFSFIIAPIGYIIKIILSDSLSVEDIWILYGIISFVTLLATYNDLWITESLKYFIPKFIVDKDYSKIKTILLYSFFFQFISSIIICLLLFFWSDFLANNYFHSQKSSLIIQIFCLFFLGINIFQLLNTFFISIQDAFYFKLTEFIRKIFVFIFIFLTWFLDFWILENYSIAWVFWLYCGVIFSILVFIKKYYFKYFKWVKLYKDKLFLKKIISYSFMIFLWAQAWVILSQLDMQMIVYLLWSYEAWLYTNYLSIISLPFMFIWPIFALFLPVISELHKKKEIQKIKDIKRFFSKYFISIWIISNSILFVFWPQIATILFGEKFIDSWIILRYSSLLLIFNFLLQINFNILGGIWKISERVKIIWVAIFFNFILNLIFIRLLWVYWPALATWIGWIFIFILSERSIWSKYKTKFDWLFVIKNLLATIIIMTLTYFYLIIPYFSWLNRQQTFIYLSLYLIIYWSFFIAINLKEIKLFVIEIKKMRKTKD